MHFFSATEVERLATSIRAPYCTITFGLVAYQLLIATHALTSTVRFDRPADRTTSLRTNDRVGSQ